VLPLSIGFTAALLGAVSLAGDESQGRFARASLGLLLVLTVVARLGGLVG